MRCQERFIGGVAALLIVTLVLGLGSLPAGAAEALHVFGSTIGGTGTHEIAAARTPAGGLTGAPTSSHPLVAIRGRSPRFRPTAVGAPQIPYGSPCDGSDYSFVLDNGTGQAQTVTIDGQDLVALPPGGTTVVCGTSTDDTTFTATFGLVSAPRAHLTATFVAVQVARPTVQIGGSGPGFSPQSVTAPEIADGSPCDADNYSFLLANATSSDQTVTLDGHALVTEAPGTSTVICGTNAGGSPFTASFGLTSNPSATLTVHFG